MQNSLVLKNLRFTFQFNDTKMVQIFDQADFTIEKEEVRSWLTNEDDRTFQEINDEELATFLNGFIIENRGKREGAQPPTEKKLNNNIILKKLKIALDLRSDDMLDIFKLAGKPISVHEIADFMRNPKQAKYKACLDQYLRNFLSGLQIKYRDNEGLKDRKEQSL